MPNPLYTAFPETGIGAVDSVRDLFRQRVAVAAYTVQEIRDNDWTGHLRIELIATGALYEYDADEAGADDGAAIIRDAEDNAFVLVARAGDMLAAIYDPAEKREQVLTAGDLLDEDDFASDSATKTASQQSIKAYVAARLAGPLLPGNGSAAAPVYSFASDTGLGLYQLSGNFLAVASAGVGRVRFGTGSFAPITANGYNIGTNTLPFGVGYLTALELGHGTDTTLARAAAGVVSVEGNLVPSPGSQTEGDLLYRGAGAWARLAKGGAGQILRMNAGATAPEWVSEDADLAAIAAAGNGSILAATTASFLTSHADKLGHITVTQAVDLDAIETRVNALDASVILKGTWDASAGSFPGSGSAQAGESWIVSVGGTVGGVVFTANDRIVAIADNASTSVYAANWHKLDYTDAVLSVAGKTGAVTLVRADLSDASADGQALIGAANYAAMRGLLDLEAGTDFYSKTAADAAFEPKAAALTSWAAVTRASGFDAFVATPSKANLQALITDDDFGFLDTEQSWTARQIFDGGDVSYAEPLHVVASADDTGGPIAVYWHDRPGGGLAGDYFSGTVYGFVNDADAFVYGASFYGHLINSGAGVEHAGLDIWGQVNGVETLEMRSGGGIAIGNPTGGLLGTGKLNAQEVRDDNSLLSCYVIEAAVNGSIDAQRWHARVPDRSIPAVPARRRVRRQLVARQTRAIVMRDGRAVETWRTVRTLEPVLGEAVPVYDSRGRPLRRSVPVRDGAGRVTGRVEEAVMHRPPVIDEIPAVPARTERRLHEPMLRFAARLGTPYDPLTLDGYARHWREKGHLTSMPDESKFDPVTNLSVGAWIQRLLETVEIHAVLIEHLNQRTRA